MVDSLPEQTIEVLDDLSECLPLSEEMNLLTDLMIRLLQQGSPIDSDVKSLGLAAIHLYPRESEKAAIQREKHPAVYSAITLIREHYAEELTLSALASKAGFSAEHLVRLFNQYERTTPIQYLWQFRVTRAVELLNSTGLTISEIAERCGIKTSHHLARLVKQSTGRTATEIRRMSWGSESSNN